MEEKPFDIPTGRVLAEILRLQRWAGGETVDAARIFGLMNGFESVLCTDDDKGISRETQDLVEDMLQDIEDGNQGTSGPSIKDRLYKDGVDEIDAGRILTLCQLQSRFTDAIQQIEEGPGCIFHSLSSAAVAKESQWFGALHYLELVDCSSDSRTQMYAVFAPTVPRVGDIIEPEQGSLMVVAAIHYKVTSFENGKGPPHRLLVPFVYVEAPDEDEGHDDK